MDIKQSSDYTNTLVNCILNKFKLSVQFEIKNNKTFRDSNRISKSLNYDELDESILKLILFDRIKKLKLSCEGDYYESIENYAVKPKLLQQSAESTETTVHFEEDSTLTQGNSLVVINLNTILYAFLALLVIFVVFSTFLAYLINKYQKSKVIRHGSSGTCLKKFRKILKSFRKSLQT